eukprot:UN05285
MLYYLGSWFNVHWAFFTNSISHDWNIDGEGSCSPNDTWWVGALNGGEGFHKLHHVKSNIARHGREWYQIDACYWWIVGMEKAGIVWGVHHPKAITIA